MLSLVMVQVLAASATLRLATTAMNVSEVPKEQARFFEDHFAQQLSLQEGLKVTTPSDVSQVLGLERQRQLLGCVETSCLAEIAGALGVDAVVASSLGRIGETWTLNVRVLGAKNADTLSLFSARAEKEGEVLDLLTKAAEKVARDLLSTGATPGGGGSLRSKAWIPAVAGAVLAGTGGALFGLSRGAASRIATNTPAFQDVGELRATGEAGKYQQAAGVALLVAGAAALATAGVVFALGGADAPVAVTVGAAPGAFGVGLAGTLP